MSTDYKKQRDQIVSGRTGRSKDEPTPMEFLAHALNYDPEQDGVYLCQRCGITYDHECAYGGWHSIEEQMLQVSVGWMD